MNPLVVKLKLQTKQNYYSSPLILQSNCHEPTSLYTGSKPVHLRPMYIKVPLH